MLTCFVSFLDILSQNKYRLKNQKIYKIMDNLT
ncbi:hypothetical protein SGGBAA2069_c15380 [Streptococcus gallolyticus subsp. gallolyticus ATCC BAA-2069]|nr:hypothetical protein SGGBAA2069_c15380 [Streptococcus gallolyticus subsp. gallolyticus ATCC BAA-2069]